MKQNYNINGVIHLYKTNVVNTDDFVIYEIINGNNSKIDSVVINKYTPETVLYFYGSDTEYIEEYEEKMRSLVNAYEDVLDYDDAMENRSTAEFYLYKSVKGLE